LISGPRLELVLLSGDVLDAFLAGDRPHAERLAGFVFPDEFARDDEWVARRRGQVRADPTWAPWSLRVMVLRGEQRMVGSTSFHGPPGINSLDDPSAAEFGYTVFEAFRNLGYATETGRAMMDWAQSEHGVRRFISSIEPNNSPSIRVIEKLGFRPMNLVIDGETIFECRLS
jgi:ribosomal-protein-alanine N-acetyltransferase